MQKTLGKTITTHLLDGTIDGIKKTFISNSLCCLVSLPRTKLSEITTILELKQPSMYLLIGAENTAYVGETENFSQRVKNQVATKDFWHEVLVFLAKDNSFTKADVKYLEYMAIQTAQSANLYNLDENNQQPKQPNLPAHQQDEVTGFFDDIKVLTNFMGYHIFDQPIIESDELLYCKNNQGTDATAIYANKSIRVLSGSKVRKIPVQSYKNKEQRQQKLQRDAVEDAGFYTLKKDIELASPSAASSFCLGRPSNGWADWQNKQEEKLKDIIKK